MVRVNQIAVAAIGLVVTQPSVAQTPLASSGQSQQGNDSVQAGGGLEDIIVTARRRDESLQSVPLAVTAFTSEALRTANITGLQSLAAITPSLVASPTNSRGNVPAFAIRGQRQASADTTSDPSVGIYIAEAVQTRPFGLGQALFDLESIQVLKGPQGTLFGRNTTGGAILIQPQRPKLNILEGYVTARYGNLDRFDVQGALNVPLGDSVAARIAYNRTRRSGYVTNLTSGARLSGEHTDTIRGILLFEPSTNFANTLYVDYFDSNQTPTGSRLRVLNPAGSAPRLYPGLAGAFARQQQTFDFYQNEGDKLGVSKATNLGITNVTVGQVSDYLTLKNVINFRDLTATDNNDLDGTAFDILYSVDSLTGTQLTEELQLLGRTPDGRFSWITGLYYFAEDGFRGTLTATNGVGNARRDGRSAAESFSVFAQADYKLTDTLTLTAGGRYTWDDRRFSQRITNPLAGGVCTLCLPESKGKFDAPTYTVSLSWQIDPRKLLYVAHRRGYRSGGFNSGATTASALNSFEAETVKDVEGGFKADWRFGDSALRTNLAVYRSEYSNIQRLIVVLVNGIPTNSVFNAASATITGAEFETQFFPVKELELVGSLSYTDPVYKSFNFITTGGAVSDLSRNTFAFIPKWTYRVGTRLRVPLSGQERAVLFAADYVYQSKIFFSEVNSDQVAQNGYGLLNGRVELQNALPGISLSAFGRNLTGRRYFMSGTDLLSSVGISYGSPGEPRTYGIEASFRF